jgi:drug/metabolite transporter (DMT)-like permease
MSNKALTGIVYGLCTVVFLAIGYGITKLLIAEVPFYFAMSFAFLIVVCILIMWIWYFKFVDNT